MMDELIDHLQWLHFHRIGFVMTCHRGGVGYTLLTSSYLYYQGLLPERERIPLLPPENVNERDVAAWLRRHQPEVVISSGRVSNFLQGLGHRYRLVGTEAVNLVLTQFTLKLTGVPTTPKVVLVDSHRRDGFTLPTGLPAADAPAPVKRFVRAEGH
jgi:hypothetical protein